MFQDDLEYTLEALSPQPSGQERIEDGRVVAAVTRLKQKLQRAQSNALVSQGGRELGKRLSDLLGSEFCQTDGDGLDDRRPVRFRLCPSPRQEFTVVTISLQQGPFGIQVIAPGVELFRQILI